MIHSLIFSTERVRFFFHKKHILEHTGTFDRKNQLKKTLSKQWLDLHGFTLLITITIITINIILLLFIIIIIISSIIQLKEMC